MIMIINVTASWLRNHPTCNWGHYDRGMTLPGFPYFAFFTLGVLVLVLSLHWKCALWQPDLLPSRGRSSHVFFAHPGETPWIGKRDPDTAQRSRHGPPVPVARFQRGRKRHGGQAWQFFSLENWGWENKDGGLWLWWLWLIMYIFLNTHTDRWIGLDRIG